MHNTNKQSVSFAVEYGPGGMLMPGRVYTAASPYKYGFNGQERDDEIYGTGNSYTAEFWQYDSRLGRRWNIDPVKKEWESPYATFRGNPVWWVDPNGDNAWKPEVDEEGNINLIAEKGDNSETLRKFFKTDDNAKKS